MGLLPIMEKGQPLACQADWPLFYMNDFSKLGLVVASLTEAAAVLEANGFQVEDHGRALQFSSHEQLLGVFAALTDHRIAYELADLIGCVYQG